MTLVGDQRRIIRNQTPIIAHRVERYWHGFSLSSFLPSARPRCVASCPSIFNGQNVLILMTLTYLPSSDFTWSLLHVRDTLGEDEDCDF